MSVSLPNGVTLALATSYGAAKTVTAITNYDPARVTTSAANGFTDGDFIEVTSGWAKLNQRVVRVDNADSNTNTFDLEGIDTSSVTSYPAGTGGGSAREITAFTQVTQVLDVTTAGGEMQFTTYSFLEQDFETQLPTQSSPQTITINVADDPTLAGYIALKEAAEARDIRALKVTFPNGAVLLYNGYVSFNETPSMTKNEVMAVTATFSLLSRPVRYAA